MSNIPQAIHLRIAQMARAELAERLAQIGVDTDVVSEDQLRDTLTYNVKAGAISLASIDPDLTGEPASSMWDTFVPWGLNRSPFTS